MNANPEAKPTAPKDGTVALDSGGYAWQYTTGALTPYWVMAGHDRRWSDKNFRAKFGPIRIVYTPPDDEDSST